MAVSVCTCWLPWLVLEISLGQDLCLIAHISQSSPDVIDMLLQLFCISFAPVIMKPNLRWLLATLNRHLSPNVRVLRLEYSMGLVAKKGKLVRACEGTSDTHLWQVVAAFELFFNCKGWLVWVWVWAWLFVSLWTGNFSRVTPAKI